METQSRKQLFYEDEVFKIEVEPYGDTACLHVQVFNWSLSALKQAYPLFVRLEDSCLKAGFSRMATFTPNPKFVKLFGGTTVQTFTIDEQPIEVIVWELK